MFLAIINNAGLLHFELGRKDLARGCMEQLAIIIALLPSTDRDDKVFFSTNIVMLEATHGSPAA